MQKFIEGFEKNSEINMTSTPVQQAIIGGLLGATLGATTGDPKFIAGAAALGGAMSGMGSRYEEDAMNKEREVRQTLPKEELVQRIKKQTNPLLGTALGAGVGAGMGGISSILPMSPGAGRAGKFMLGGAGLAGSIGLLGSLLARKRQLQEAKA